MARQATAEWRSIGVLRNRRRARGKHHTIWSVASIADEYRKPDGTATVFAAACIPTDLCPVLTSAVLCILLAVYFPTTTDQ